VLLALAQPSIKHLHLVTDDSLCKSRFKKLNHHLINAHQDSNVSTDVTLIQAFNSTTIDRALRLTKYTSGQLHLEGNLKARRFTNELQLALEIGSSSKGRSSGGRANARNIPAPDPKVLGYMYILCAFN
jgi:hypothetical protein